MARSRAALQYACGEEKALSLTFTSGHSRHIPVFPVGLCFLLIVISRWNFLDTWLKNISLFHGCVPSSKSEHNKMQVHQGFLPGAVCPDHQQEGTLTHHEHVSFCKQVPVWKFRETRVPVHRRVLAKQTSLQSLGACPQADCCCVTGLRLGGVSVVWRFCEKEEYSPHRGSNPPG